MRQLQQQFQDSSLITKMDPRPIHFEYRRPRHCNPTYESSHFYDSLFPVKDGPKNHQGPRPRNPEASKSFSEHPQPQMKRANSTDINSSKKIVELQGIGAYRYDSKDEGKGRSKMASYGNNLLRNSSMEQTQVYKRQEKEFNIINFHQKEHKPALKLFPKLSLEHRLLEKSKRQEA